MANYQEQRQAKHRLAWIRRVEEDNYTVASTCRYYGISGVTYYKWYQRYKECGVDGLKSRSRKPHHSPRATKPEVIEKIAHLRQHYYFGPEKIGMYLKRYHNISLALSTIQRILHKLGMPLLPANQRYKLRAER